MKKLLITENDRNRILSQYDNTLLVETKNFNKLIKSKLGDIKPLLNEQSLYDSIKSEKEGDAFRDWVFKNYKDIGVTYNLDSSDHPNSIYYHSQSMNNVWNHKIGNKTLGQLYLDSKKSTSNKLLSDYEPKFQFDSPAQSSTYVDKNYLNLDPQGKPYIRKPETPKLNQQVAKADYRSQAERAANVQQTQNILALKSSLDQKYGDRHLLSDNPYGRQITKDEFYISKPDGMSLEEMFDWFKWGIKWFGPGGQVAGRLLDGLGAVIKGIQAYYHIQEGKDLVSIVTSIFGSIGDIAKAFSLNLPKIPYLSDITKRIETFMDRIGFDKVMDKLDSGNKYFLSQPKYLQALIVMLAKYGWKYFEAAILIIIDWILIPLQEFTSEIMPNFSSLIKTIIGWFRALQKLATTADLLIDKPDIKGLFNVR